MLGLLAGGVETGSFGTVVILLLVIVMPLARDLGSTDVSALKFSRDDGRVRNTDDCQDGQSCDHPSPAIKRSHRNDNTDCGDRNRSSNHAQGLAQAQRTPSPDGLAAASISPHGDQLILLSLVGSCE